VSDTPVAVAPATAAPGTAAPGAAAPGTAAPSAAEPGATTRDGVMSAARELAEAGCDTPRLDAELLLASALGCDRAMLVTRGTDELPEGALQDFARLIARRAAREPVAYILGRKEFRRLSLAVDRRVLIPRPETELLVEVGTALPTGWRVLDVGTGSGAVALALKDERPDLDVIGIDVDPDTLDVARDNAERLGLDVTFAHGDLLAGQHGDAVLANLPYVAEDTPGLAPEITDYEPPRALFGGPDGLDLIRRLVSQLNGISAVALEISPEQAAAVADLLRGAGLVSVERLRDLAGRERVIVGRR
jgi:release factor glutamine methyltransferase